MKKFIDSLIPHESRPEKVGPRITAVRLSLKQSKAQFADSIRLDRSTLTKIEKGEKGLDIAIGENIFALYGFGLDFIYRGEVSDIPYDLRPNVLNILAKVRKI